MSLSLLTFWILTSTAARAAEGVTVIEAEDQSAVVQEAPAALPVAPAEVAPLVAPFQTRRLNFRPAEDADLAALTVIQQTEGARLISVGPGDPLEVAQHYGHWPAPRIDWHHMAFTITDKFSGKILGEVSLYRWDQNNAYFGLVMAPDPWFLGLATEAALGLMNHGFRNLALTRYVAHVDDDAPNELQIMRNAGFVEEFTTIGRHHFGVNQEQCEAMLHGMPKLD